MYMYNMVLLFDLADKILYRVLFDMIAKSVDRYRFWVCGMADPSYVIIETGCIYTSLRLRREGRKGHCPHAECNVTT